MSGYRVSHRLLSQWLYQFPALVTGIANSPADGVPCEIFGGKTALTGNLDEDNKGMPVSRGYPIWFVTPDEFSECIQATALALNTDNVPAVIAEIKIEVERERDANPRSNMLEYKAKRELSETDVDIILNELKRFGIMEAFMGGTHSVDINGVHSLTLMFPAKGN